MVEGPIPVNPQTPSNIEMLKAPDLQMLLQDYAQSRRELSEEKRSGEKKLLEERERSRWETERIRSEYEVKLKTVEHENWALVRAIGRLNEENDRLREEVAVLRVSNVTVSTPASTGTPPAQEMPSTIGHNFAPTGQVPVPVMKPGDLLGKPIHIGPTKGQHYSP